MNSAEAPGREEGGGGLFTVLSLPPRSNKNAMTSVITHLSGLTVCVFDQYIRFHELFITCIEDNGNLALAPLPQGNIFGAEVS